MKIIPHYKTTGDIINLKISRKNHIKDIKEIRHRNRNRIVKAL